MPEEPRMREVIIHQIKRRRGHVIPAQLVPEDHKHWHHEHDRRRQYPVCPPHIKSAQPDRRRLLQLLHQQHRDQVSGENKEDSSSQARVRSRNRRLKAHLRPVPPHHQRNRNGPSAIERRNSVHEAQPSSRTLTLSVMHPTQEKIFKKNFPSRETSRTKRVPHPCLAHFARQGGILTLSLA